MPGRSRPGAQSRPPVPAGRDRQLFREIDMQKNMESRVPIADVMTRSPVSVDVGIDLESAHKQMREHGIRHLPVTEGGRPVSMLSERDIHLAVAVHKDLHAAEQITVGDVCTLDTYMVGPDAKLADVVVYMADNQIGSVVITENDELCGIFTVTDACRELGRLLTGG